jgi:hypothetical protein
MKKNYALVQQYEYEAEYNKFDKYFKDKLDELYRNIKPPKAVFVNPPSPMKEHHIRMRPEIIKPASRNRDKENAVPVHHQIEQIDNTTPTTCISIPEPIEKKKPTKPRPKVS